MQRVQDGLRHGAQRPSAYSPRQHAKVTTACTSRMTRYNAEILAFLLSLGSCPGVSTVVGASILPAASSASATLDIRTVKSNGVYNVHQTR